MRTLLLALGLAACAVAARAEDGALLRFDPFVTPPLLREAPAPPPPRPAVRREGPVALPAAAAPAPEPPWQPQLRGTLVSDRGSVADVDGVVLQVGQEVQGHRLVEVRERAAVFEKKGVKVLVSMDAEPAPLPPEDAGSGRGPG